MKPTPIGRFTDTPSYEELQREVARLRLTDAEQLAIAWAAREADEWDEEDTPEVAAHAETLHELAKRLF